MAENQNATISEVFQEASASLTNRGKEAAINLLRNHLNNWRNQPITVAVTGSVNAGKSSFVNAIRGLEDEDEGAAETDVVEKTTEPKDYPHPENPLLVYADLPGVGTPKNPRNETYIQNMRFERYDAFLILSESSFTEDDKWLANEIDNFGKPFFFVRTKIDQDISNNKRKRKSENETKRNVRRNVELYLNAASEVERQNIFLISNFEKHQHDFPRLVIAITESLPAIKQEALTYSLKNFSIEIVNEKIRRLEERVIKVAMLSATCAMVPFPGVSMFVDVILIVEEFIHYHKQLCFNQHSQQILDNDAIRDEIQNLLSAALTSASAEELTSKLSSIFRIFSNELSEYISLNALEEVARYLPVAGTVISSGLSFYTTRRVLLAKIKELGDKEKEFFNTSSSAEIENMIDRL